MSTLSEKLAKALAFDEMDVHKQAILCGYDSNQALAHKAFEYGSKSEHTRLAPFHENYVTCVKSLQGVKHYFETFEEDYEKSGTYRMLCRALTELTQALEKNK